MKIIINGQEKEFTNGVTLDTILSTLGLDGKVMAAAVNMDIVKQDVWKNYILKDGDKLELLDFHLMDIHIQILLLDFMKALII